MKLKGVGYSTLTRWCWEEGIQLQLLYLSLLKEMIVNKSIVALFPFFTLHKKDFGNLEDRVVLIKLENLDGLLKY